MSARRSPQSNRDQIDVCIDTVVVGQLCQVGTLFHAVANSGSVFSFNYDPAWLAHPKAFQIDPDLQLHQGEAYPNREGAFGIFLDSAPDRWGRILLDRREILQARTENRAPRSLNDWDYLLGVYDGNRMGALRFRRDHGSVFLDDDPTYAAPTITSLRELQAASLALENPDA